MIRDAGSYRGRSRPPGGRTSRAQTLIRRAEVIDSADQVHAMLQGQCAARQRPSSARQRRQAFAEGRVEPVTVDRRIAPPTAAPERRV